jgi:ribosomal protein L11 methyltransferase
LTSAYVDFDTMNLRTDFPVVLWIESPEGADRHRDELLATLADYPVIAIHESELERGLRWAVSFGENAWQVFDSPDEDTWVAFHPPFSAPLDVNWRRYPDLGELITATAGRDVLRKFGSPCVRCELRAETNSWSLTRFEESHGRVQVGRIMVAPPWHFPDPDGTTIILKIKPSMGFGTGHHPSTRLALSLLQQLDCEGRDVLDVGTGSAVLAMAAARLGAARVCAIDRDSNALVAAADGLRRNALTSRVELTQADISTDALGVFDLVVANLEAAQIRAWADALLRHVRPTGHLLLSGFLAAEAELVSRALPQPARLVEYEDDWAAVVMHLCGGVT